MDDFEKSSKLVFFAQPANDNQAKASLLSPQSSQLADIRTHSVRKRRPAAGCERPTVTESDYFSSYSTLYMLFSRQRRLFHFLVTFRLLFQLFIFFNNRSLHNIYRGNNAHVNSTLSTMRQVFFTKFLFFVPMIAYKLFIIFIIKI